MWQVIDDTGKGRGYLSIYKDGVRVADVFPFAKNADEKFLREQAARIVDTMNGIDMIAATTALPKDHSFRHLSEND